MDRTSAANNVDIGGGRRGYRDRNLGAGLRGTSLVAADRNAIQEEILKLIEDAGLTPNASNWTQLREACRILFGGGGTLAPTGWQRLPGGLLLQWTNLVVPALTGVTWTFPIAYSTALYVLHATSLNTEPSKGEFAYVINPTLTSTGVDNYPGMEPNTIYVSALGI
jgi:hypothetical protein